MLCKEKLSKKLASTCANRVNRALKVNQSNCVERCRTKSRAPLFGGIQDRLDYLSQNLASLPRTQRKIRKWTAG